MNKKRLVMLIAVLVLSICLTMAFSITAFADDEFEVDGGEITVSQQETEAPSESTEPNTLASGSQQVEEKESGQIPETETVSENDNEKSEIPAEVKSANSETEPAEQTVAKVDLQVNKLTTPALTTPQPENVAKIGDVEYATLAAAIAAVPTDGPETTIVMLADTVLESGITIPANKTIIIDLNGKTISSIKNEAAGSALVKNSGTLTIRDSSEEGKGKLTTEAIQPDESGIPGYANNTITNHGTLTIESGSVINTSSKGAACYAIDNQNYGGGTSSILNITGGTVTSTGKYAIRMWLHKSCDNKVEITGGNVKSLWVQDDSADRKGSLAIKNATFTGDVKIGYDGAAENFALDIQNSTFGGLVQYELDATKEGNTVTFKNNTCAPFYMTQPSKILDDGTYIISKPVNIGWVWVETGTEKNYPTAEGLDIDLDSIYVGDETGNWYQGYLSVAGQLARFDSYIKDGYILLKTDRPDTYIICKPPVPTPPTEQPARKIVVPVEDADTVEVEATITGTKATVSDISEETIEKILNGENATGEIKIDCSQIPNTFINKVEIKTANIKTIAASDAEGLKVIMSTGAIAIDKAAVTAVATLADGTSVVLVIEDIEDSNLNAAQKLTAKAEDNLVAIVDSYILSNAQKITKLDDGKITLTFSKELLKNYDPEVLHVYELKEDGTMQEIKFDIVDGEIVFDISILSTYIIVHD